MNNDELKKKIMEILHRDFITREVTPVYVGEDGKEKEVRIYCRREI